MIVGPRKGQCRADELNGSGQRWGRQSGGRRGQTEPTASQSPARDTRSHFWVKHRMAVAAQISPERQECPMARSEIAIRPGLLVRQES